MEHTEATRKIFEHIEMVYGQAGLKKSAAAEKVGLKSSHFSQIMAGAQRCPLDIFLQICEGLGIKHCEFDDQSKEVHRNLMISQIAHGMDWDEEKATLWMTEKNVQLGGISGDDMLDADRIDALYKFIEVSLEENEPPK